MVLGWQPIAVVFFLALSATILLRPVVPLEMRRLWNIVVPLSLPVVWFGWPWVSGLLYRGFFHPGIALAGIGVALCIAIVRVLWREGVYYSPRSPMTR
jgi:hypothetical protein